tara:strand:+ start:457 stop:1194 length:738 start_codon:yes stop_codon:yes gene_type:complete
MKTEEKLALPEIEQDTNKYKKHINDLIEDAQVEAEIEAKKKIRSKNSRVFSISILGLGLVALVYFQSNSPSALETISEKKDTVLLKFPAESAEEKLAKQVPVLEIENTQIEFKESIIQKSMIEPAKITFAKKVTLNDKTKLSPPILKRVKKSSQTPKSAIKGKEPVAKKASLGFFVQTGAFSQKKNAEASLKKLQSEGFSPLIHILNRGDTKTYLVQLGVFSNREKANLAQEKLARVGYAKTIIK